MLTSYPKTKRTWTCTSFLAVTNEIAWEWLLVGKHYVTIIITVEHWTPGDSRYVTVLGRDSFNQWEIRKGEKIPQVFQPALGWTEVYSTVFQRFPPKIKPQLAVVETHPPAHSFCLSSLPYFNFSTPSLYFLGLPLKYTISRQIFISMFGFVEVHTH